MWGISVHRHARFVKRVLAAWVFCAAAILLCACSPGADYPALPAVHDMPAPRADTPMNAEQVKQATDALITERSQLNTDAQNASKSEPPPPQAGSTAKATPAAKKKKKPLSPAQTATTGSTQTAGADAKP